MSHHAHVVNFFIITSPFSGHFLRYQKHFGEGTIAAAQVSPSYKGVKWVLSKSHPMVDICDSLAAHEKGLAQGFTR